MRKYYIYLIAILILAAVAAAVYFSFENQDFASPAAGQDGDEPIGKPSPFKKEELKLSTVIEVGTPKGVVTVNNFYKKALSQEDTTVLIFKEGNKYSFSYDTYDSSFWINILDQNETDEVRRIAEAEFLKILGISQEDACKLNVALTIPVGPSPGLPSRDLGLSFCPPLR